MDTLLNLWNSLSPEDRSKIVVGVTVGVAVLVIGGILKFFGKSILGAAKRIFMKAPPPTQAPAPVPHVILKVETPEPVQLPSPAPVSLSPAIPRPPTVAFVSRRDREGHDIVAKLKKKLGPQENQLIALWGPGGVGKTTLAAEAARALRERFAQRIVWVSAEARADFTLSTLLDEVATQLGRSDLRRLAIEPKAEEVRKLVASPPALIVLDNFETIVPKEQTRCAEWIAQHALCPALITTRQNVGAAENITIDAMSMEEAHEYMERLVVKTRDPRAFVTLDRERLIQTAEANPLVLQWIVAQIDLAQEANAVLDDLAKGRGDAAQRVFDRSFDLPQVGDDARAALLALSMFVPTASRGALSEVAGLDGDLARLNEAVKDLAPLWLVGTEWDHRLKIDGLTRELAKARLSQDERTDEFHRRFVAYFLGYAIGHVTPTPDDYDALESEKDNLLGAMDIAFNMGDWDRVMQLGDILTSPASGMLSVRGYWDAVIQYGEQALAAAREAKDRWHIGAYTDALGTMFAQRGDYSSARENYLIALEIARELDAKGGLSATLHQLGIVAQKQGDLAEARRLYDESLEIKKGLGDQHGIASTLHQLGIVAQKQGDLAEARRLYDESLEIKKGLGDQHGIAPTLHQLGMVAQDQGDLAEARRLYDESLEIKKGLGDQHGIATTLHQLGWLEEHEGDRTKAERLFRDALRILENVNLPDAEIARASLERVGGKS